MRPAFLLAIVLRLIGGRRDATRPATPKAPDYGASLAYLARATARGEDVSDAIAVLHGMIGGSITDMAEDVEATAALLRAA